MSSEVVSLRLPIGTVDKLKLLACRRSLQERREIRWTRIVKDMIQIILRHEENQKEGEQPEVDGLP
jgi:hypothetical protein